MSNFTCLLKNVCLNYTHKKKTGEVLHCMFFLWMTNIYTQLNVYMWMYLRNSRIVLILVKSNVGKQGRKCLPFMLPLWSPPRPELLHRHRRPRAHTHTHAQAHATHVHTNTHIHKSSNALLTTSQRRSSNCCQ